MYRITLFNREIKVTVRKDRAELFVCFAIATVFWFLVKLSQEYETTWTFHFNYILPEQEAFLESPPATVEARIAGGGWKLMYFTLFRKDKPLTFDLRFLPVSVLDRRLVMDRIQNVLSSESLVVRDIDVDFITLSMEPRATRKVPIGLRYRVNIQPQHDLSVPILLIPDSVTISGPSSLVDSLLFWPTDSGSTPPLRADYSMDIPLAKDPGKVLELDVGKVKAEIRVEPVVEKTIYFVPVTAVNAPESIRIFPASVTVYCVVGMTAYNELGAQDFTIEADLGGIARKSDRNTVPLTLTCAPEHVKNVRFSPQSVEFFFLVKE